ncbi:2-isopropylmalate synthase [Actinophytocola sp.]|uniref:2-isopropylmalate synthase n=1 Tax=Actinophytocola sp. TaxID=1872138 RepID=UPI00389AB7C8
MLSSEQRPSSMPAHRYRPYTPIGLTDRQWPNRRMTKAPLWGSVDLRDGNQSLIDPMDIHRKRRMFELLVRLGFKEIEVGFPTSGRADWSFVRDLTERGAIPDDVLVQVMSPARDDLIGPTVRCLEGIPKAILQIHNPISTVQRRVVFDMDRSQVKKLALTAAEYAMRMRDSARARGTALSLQYAPESFTQAEPEFGLEVCNAIVDLWQRSGDEDVRINIPATVEVFPPQEFGDRIEWINRNLSQRDSVILGIHPHNDRGTAVAAAEFGLLAGADRIEGTLFGNGERTGNVCLVTLAMNMLSQGVDPMLEFGDLDEVRRIAEECTGLPVSPRHPWGGDLVYTSFAGSHQDAISKGLAAQRPEEPWDVPYLPIDPGDIGRDYKALIRISNQSGKGGIAYLLRTEYGLDLPRRMQIEFAALVQEYLDEHGGEVSAELLWTLFHQEYLAADATANGQGDARPVLLATVRQNSTTGDTEEHACFCEVQVGSTTCWGAGVAGDLAAAEVAAFRSAAHRAAAAALVP